VTVFAELLMWFVDSRSDTLFCRRSFVAASCRRRQLLAMAAADAAPRRIITVRLRPVDDHHCVVISVHRCGRCYCLAAATGRPVLCCHFGPSLWPLLLPCCCHWPPGVCIVWAASEIRSDVTVFNIISVLVIIQYGRNYISISFVYSRLSESI